MKYLDFKAHFEPFRIFSINDIKKWNEKFDTRRLVEWQQRGYIKKIVNRWYMFSDLALEERLSYLVANRIYSPSYISFESAMSHHRLIPEGVYTVTSATSLKTNSFETPVGRYTYRHLKPELMFGYGLIDAANQKCRMAYAEKAILDYLYLNTQINSAESIEELRVNPYGINQEKLESYLTLFKNKSLERRAELFLKVIDYA